MLKRTLLLSTLLFIFSFVAYAQTNWYVGPDGTDASGHGTSAADPFASVTYAADFLTAGDTCFVLAGTYTNASYPTKIYYSNESTVRINQLHGNSNNWITFKPYNDNDGVVFKGNGRQIFQVRSSSYIRVEGFEMYGEVENIPLDTAVWWQFAYRQNGSTETLWRESRDSSTTWIESQTYPALSNTSRPDYFNTKGLLVQDSDHIELVNNHIHHMPGTGLRAQVCSYVDVIGNEINDCSRRSSVGTHGLVFDSTRSNGSGNGTKCRIERNKVHHNYNEVYSWNPTKTFIVPHIDEGKGISMQRNDAAHGWTTGWFNIENNICYRNGFSGVHTNYGSRMKFVNNTCYRNGFSEKGNNIGISMSHSDNIIVRNNISWADTEWGGFAISVDPHSSDITVANNLIFGILDPDIDDIDTNTPNENPDFTDPENADFTLLPGSPAINTAGAGAPMMDYSLNQRDATPDMGALEFMPALPVSLLDFHGKALADGHNELTWITAAEVDNDYFTLEKSADGRNWQHLTKVNGAGTDSEVNDYHFTDEKPFAGLTYYRLSQTDFDGSTAYFPVVTLEQADLGIATEIYPNPFRENLTVITKETTVAVYDILGKQVNPQVQRIADGEKVQLNFSTLPDGIYFLHAGRRSFRVVKE